MIKYIRKRLIYYFCVLYYLIIIKHLDIKYLSIYLKIYVNSFKKIKSRIFLFEHNDN